MAQGLHHHHKRTRERQGRLLIETRFTRTLDYIVYPIAMVSLLFAMPQLYEVWILGETGGVSILSWSAWAFFNLFWIVYGIVHRAHAITFLYVGWFIVNSAMAIGAFLNSW